MRKYKSPNGAHITGTSDLVQVTASISGISDDGTPEYQGGSTVHWDSQITKSRSGKMVFIDEDGEEWTFDQLTAIEDE